MTPGQKNIVKSLIAVAWADGQMRDLEAGVIEGLLCGFDASDEEERELLEYAQKPRTLNGDIPLGVLSRDDRELVLSNAALIIQADGVETAAERRLMTELSQLLGFSEAEVAAILSALPAIQPRAPGGTRD
jgi:uncharacterized tellurite resistance protein B-like protein